jgi:hypothetical protein
VYKNFFFFEVFFFKVLFTLFLPTFFLGVAEVESVKEILQRPVLMKRNKKILLREKNIEENNFIMEP